MKREYLTKSELILYLSMWRVNKDPTGKGKIISTYEPMLSKMVSNMVSEDNSLDFEELYQEGFCKILDYFTNTDLNVFYKLSNPNVSIYTMLNRYLCGVAYPLGKSINISDVEKLVEKISETDLTPEYIANNKKTVADALGVSLSDINTLLKYVLTKTKDISKLNTYNVVPKDGAGDLTKVIDREELKEKLEEVLDTLTPREGKVIRLRFGLDDGRERTLEEVGREFNIHREKVRKIEMEAMHKLRNPLRARELKDFVVS